MMTHQRGIVSLTTAIVVSILLTIITISSVNLMISEQRQATDADQSVRAYYAAEAGVEAGILLVKNALGSQAALDSLTASNSTCQPAAVGTGGETTTCRTIQQKTNQVKGALGKEQPTQLDLFGVASDPATAKLSWNLSGVDAATPNVACDQSGNEFPAATIGNGWTGAAPIDLTVIHYPKSGGLTPSNVQARGYVLRPPGANCGSLTGPVDVQTGSSVPYHANCSAAANGAPGFNCSLTLTNFSTSEYYIIRARPRYVGTNYQIEFFDAGGAAIQIADQYVTVDATARAGDVFRRVITKMQIKGGPLLDYVLYSDTDICKNFDVDPNTGQAIPNSSSCSGSNDPLQ